jgi:methylenetetrahydrofolate reductase (NADPH)
MTRLADRLLGGDFLLTTEMRLTDSPRPEPILRGAELLAPHVDAVNVPDCTGANPHVGGLAAAALLVRAGIEPILHLACRDRNRIALQADLLGAAALGIENVFLVTGDDVTAGDHPEARRVFDLDSVQALAMAAGLRDDGRYLSGRSLRDRPSFLLGAACNPFAPPFEVRVARLAKKHAAGARFIQTQYCFDLPRLERFMTEVRADGLHERLAILVGVGPLRSAAAAEFLVRRVPGVHVPDSILARLRRTPESQREEEGLRICVETIQRIREVGGVRGIHVMAHRQEHRVAEILDRAGLTRAPAPTADSV